MTLIATLGHALGFSLAAGVNLYATVAILGLASRFGWVDLPERFAVFDSNVVIAVAAVLYIVEFFADKIPWVDSAWDAIHTTIRPVGGALIVTGPGYRQRIAIIRQATDTALTASFVTASIQGECCLPASQQKIDVSKDFRIQQSAVQLAITVVDPVTLA
jgi:uncharacterized membrane protein